MITKKAFSIIICIFMMFAMAVPAAAIGEVLAEPAAPIHCGSGKFIGKLIETAQTKLVGYSQNSCIHGNAGKLDRKLQYQVTTTYKCTGCNLNDTIAGMPYWTDIFLADSSSSVKLS